MSCRHGIGGWLLPSCWSAAFGGGNGSVWNLFLPFLKTLCVTGLSRVAKRGSLCLKRFRSDRVRSRIASTPTKRVSMMCDSRRSKIAAIFVRAMQRRERVVFANADDAVKQDRERADGAATGSSERDEDTEVSQ